MFVKRYTEYVLYKSCRLAFEAFRKGFNMVLEGSAIQVPIILKSVNNVNYHSYLEPKNLRSLSADPQVSTLTNWKEPPNTMDTPRTARPSKHSGRFFVNLMKT